MTARFLSSSQAQYCSNNTSANELAARGLRPGSRREPTPRRAQGAEAQLGLRSRFPGGTPLATNDGVLLFSEVTSFFQPAQASSAAPHPPTPSPCMERAGVRSPGAAFSRQRPVAALMYKTSLFAGCLFLLSLLLAGCNLTLSGPSPCQAFVTPNAAMEPTFYAGETVVIDTQAYASSTPRRGQEVVVSEPSNRGQEEILRIIGLPGETVRLTETQTFINGSLLSEPFVLHRGTQQPMQVTLGANEYFVMGDNRPQSVDSRSFGPVPLKDIVAEVGTDECPED